VIKEKVIHIMEDLCGSYPYDKIEEIMQPKLEPNVK